MKQVLLFSIVVISLVSGSTIHPHKRSFIGLIEAIEQASFFVTLPEHEKVITFEMLAAAETGNLKAFLDNLGYIKLFTYLDHLSQDYSHLFISYSIPYLKIELDE